ncbi:MAG: ATP-binding protein [Bryobacterales bacterium]|nr:ATP-binding protein [Bryobacterales bacterium]
MNDDGLRQQASDPAENPFVPGQGLIPPCLAGRESEQSLIQNHLDRLARKRPLGTNLILYGPRGNGKTALLAWAVGQAQKRGIRAIRLSASQSSAKEALLDELALLPTWLRAFLGRFGGASAMGASVQLRDPINGALDSLLTRRARWGSVLLALDESHMIDKVFGRDLLEIVQARQGEGLPVIVLFAGTPDLPRHLNAIQASLWDRSEKLPIGRLDPEASADAIRVPLEAYHRSIATDALETAVRESQGYPYFLQLWGRAFWDGCPDPTAPISLADVDRVRARFLRERNLLYLNRYQELDDADLLPVAAGVAAAFAASDRASPTRVSQALQACLDGEGLASDGQAIKRVRRHLCDLGYLWLVDRESTPRYEPGIPSLMRYL